jgi:Ca-activated chloride channel family protein
MRRLALGVFVAWASGTVVVDLHGQQPPVFRTNVDLVRVDVLVTDRGRPVTGLTAADFQLKDNGVVQDVRLVTSVLAVNVILVLDTSGSVRGEQIEQLKNATRSLLGALRPGDTASLVTFAQRILCHADAERDPTVVERALEPLAPSSRTALYDALYAGLSLAARDTGRALVLLLTDGGENSSWLSHEALVESLKRSTATVYTVTGGRSNRAPGFQSAGRDLLVNIAEQGGGEALAADADKNLGVVFVRILERFRERYLLAYSPKGVKRADGWHRLAVTLKEKRGRVTARPGYFAGR